MKIIIYGFFIYILLTTTHASSKIEVPLPNLHPTTNLCNFTQVVNESKYVKECSDQTLTAVELNAPMGMGNARLFLCEGIKDTFKRICETHKNATITPKEFEKQIGGLKPLTQSAAVFCSAMKDLILNASYIDAINSGIESTVKKVNLRLSSDCDFICWDKTSTLPLCNVLLWGNKYIVNNHMQVNPGSDAKKPATPKLGVKDEKKTAANDEEAGNNQNPAQHSSDDANTPNAPKKNGAKATVNNNEAGPKLPNNGSPGDEETKENIVRPLPTSVGTSPSKPHDPTANQLHEISTGGNKLSIKEEQPEVHVDGEVQTPPLQKTPHSPKKTPAVDEQHVPIPDVKTVPKVEEEQIPPDDKDRFDEENDNPLENGGEMESPQTEQEIERNDIGDTHDGQRFEEKEDIQGEEAKPVGQKNTVPEENISAFPGPPDPPQHFFGYFMAVSLVCLVCYIGYHKKHKIMGIIFEGRKSRGGRGRRRPNTAGYRKLDCNLEEAVTSQCNSNVTHVIY